MKKWAGKNCESERNVGLHSLNDRAQLKVLPACRLLENAHLLTLPPLSIGGYPRRQAK